MICVRAVTVTDHLSWPGIASARAEAKQLQPRMSMEREPAPIATGVPGNEAERETKSSEGNVFEIPARTTPRFRPGVNSSSPGALRAARRCSM